MNSTSSVRYTKGFTLIELMIVVAIIAILSTVATPRFARMLVKANEGSTKGNLGTLRSALAIYYADNEGVYPVDNLTSLSINSKYINRTPLTFLPQSPGLNPGHPNSNFVYIASLGIGSHLDQGGWGYANVPGGSTDPIWGEWVWGSLVVNCIHRDSKGQLWPYN